MAHGGTNFGFYNGANTGQNEAEYKADLTSYDYDAPIKEHGDVQNPKYKALRRVIHECTGTPLRPLPAKIERGNYGLVKLQKVASLFDILDKICDPPKVAVSEQPLSMELSGQMFGFLLYFSEYQGRGPYNILSIPKVHDRAQVFVSCSHDGIRNRRYAGIIERWSNKPLQIPSLSCSSNTSLYILVICFAFFISEARNEKSSCFHRCYSCWSKIWAASIMGHIFLTRRGYYLLLK
jgi:beta-galactosidase